LGHRLTIAMTAWRGEVTWSDDEPIALDLAVDVESLQVLGGEGGVKPLSGPEKGLARSNALKSLGAIDYPHIRFHATDIAKTAGGYRLTGTLEIHGTSEDREVDLHVEDLGDSWRMSCEADVRQSDFGVKPYSQLMGAMKVVDTVTVSFDARYPKNG